MRVKRSCCSCLDGGERTKSRTCSVLSGAATSTGMPQVLLPSARVNRTPHQNVVPTSSTGKSRRARKTAPSSPVSTVIGVSCQAPPPVGRPAPVQLPTSVAPLNAYRCRPGTYSKATATAGVPSVGAGATVVCVPACLGIENPSAPSMVRLSPVR